MTDEKKKPKDVITINGKDYTLRPPGRAELRQFDEYVRKNKRDVMQLAKDNLDGLTPEQQASLLKAALEIEGQKTKGHIASVEYGAVLDTREGCAHMLWLCLKRDHDDLTEEDVTQAIVDASEEEFAAMLKQRDEAAGLEDEGPDDGELE